MWTSDEFPIRVDLLPLRWRGSVGLTLAPRKKGGSLVSDGVWDRDLAKDLDRLVEHHQCNVLVCLLEDRELTSLAIPELVAEAERRGMRVIRFPIGDARVPDSTEAVAGLVESIASAADAGENVVIHCRGGLGRAGTIGGCVLVHAGKEAERALEILHEVRGPHCPETRAQEDFIRRFAMADASG